MNLYKSLYLYLFNAVTDAVDLLTRGELALACSALVCAQRECEERYINASDGGKTDNFYTGSCQ